jgi:hypothetical protein
MMATQITQLPIPPSRQDPANFSARADEFLDALPTFRTEANLLATEAEQDSVTASTAATNAASSAASALASKNAAEAAFDSFDDRYLGAKNANPTLDNDGQALLTGALYYNTVVPELRVYNGTAWVTASTVGGTVTNLTVTGTFLPPDNSIALGTKTTGNYAGSVAVSGSGLSVTGSSGEGTNFVVNSNATAGNTANSLVFRDGSSNFSAGTITASLNGNANTASTAVRLSTDRTNWSNNGVITSVVGEIAWKNYGNGHTIFDASQSTSPSGSSVNSTNAQIAWSATYPTLMGWNGQSTYGVRVDSARRADSAATVDNGVFNNGGTYSINITGNASSANTAGNSNALNGFGSDVNGSGSSIVRRDDSGYIYTPYFNQTSGNNENPGISQIMVTNGGDNFLRKASIGHLGNSLNANGYRFVEPTGSGAGYYAVRAFVNFTVSNFNIGTPQQINYSRNVSSVTYIGALNLDGRIIRTYSVNLSVAIPENSVATYTCENINIQADPFTFRTVDLVTSTSIHVSANVVGGKQFVSVIG